MLSFIIPGTISYKGNLKVRRTEIR